MHPSPPGRAFLQHDAPWCGRQFRVFLCVCNNTSCFMFLFFIRNIIFCWFHVKFNIIYINKKFHLFAWASFHWMDRRSANCARASHLLTWLGMSMFLLDGPAQLGLCQSCSPACMTWHKHDSVGWLAQSALGMKFSSAYMTCHEHASFGWACTAQLNNDFSSACMSSHEHVFIGWACIKQIV